MGLDDDAEKLRQAEEWVTGDSTHEQHQAALDHIIHVLYFTERQDLRSKAFYLLQEVNRANAAAASVSGAGR